MVRVCNATKQDVTEGAEKCIKGLNIANFRPVLGIVISCGGRKWILQDDITKEIEFIKEKFGADSPLPALPLLVNSAPSTSGTENTLKLIFTMLPFGNDNREKI